MNLIRKAGRSSSAFKWKFEVFKMGIYIYCPIFVWYGFNCDYGQEKFVLPFYKKYNPELYKQLTLSNTEE